MIQISEQLTIKYTEIDDEGVIIEDEPILFYLW